MMIVWLIGTMFSMGLFLREFREVNSFWLAIRLAMAVICLWPFLLGAFCADLIGEERWPK